MGDLWSRGGGLGAMGSLRLAQEAEGCVGCFQPPEEGLGLSYFAFGLRTDIAIDEPLQRRDGEVFLPHWKQLDQVTHEY